MCEVFRTRLCPIKSNHVRKADILVEDDLDPAQVTDEEARVAVQHWIARRKRLRRRYFVLMVLCAVIAIAWEIIALTTKDWIFRVPAFAFGAAFFYCLSQFRDNRYQ